MRKTRVSPSVSWFGPWLGATLFALAALLFLPRTAHAAGSFKLKSTEVNEVSGAWHLYAKIELPKAPLTAHQSMKFNFTKTMVYERTLVDGKSEPVLTKQPLKDQQPSIESLDVDFADASGKIFKVTNFDFGLTRTRGYEAGEYKVELKTADGVVIGSPVTLILKGDNEVVDRRAIAFNAKDKSVKKVEGYDAGANQAKNDDVEHSGPQNGEVTPTGTATGFVPKEGQSPVEEENIKTRPKGCGCDVAGAPTNVLAIVASSAGLALVAVRRRRRAR
jgi:hypothetical protein